MNSWNDIELLHSIIDLPRIAEDDLIPDSASHIIPVVNTDPKVNIDYMPVMVTGCAVFQLAGVKVRVAGETSA